MVWKVVDEFVRPKNMTVGSNSPSLILNAAFHVEVSSDQSSGAPAEAPERMSPHVEVPYNV